MIGCPGQFVFVTPTLSTESAAKTSVHEELVKALCWLLRPSNTDFLVVHKFLRHAGFFLMLIARSMAQFILDSGRIKVSRPATTGSVSVSGLKKTPTLFAWPCCS